VRLVRADARDYRLPPGDLVAYLYNPFGGSVLAAVAERLAQRKETGETIVLYHTPVERSTFDGNAAFHLLPAPARGAAPRRPATAAT
jgi:hypothetical protein